MIAAAIISLIVAMPAQAHGFHGYGFVYGWDYGCCPDTYQRPHVRYSPAGYPYVPLPTTDYPLTNPFYRSERFSPAGNPYPWSRVDYSPGNSYCY